MQAYCLQIGLFVDKTIPWINKSFLINANRLDDTFQSDTKPLYTIWEHGQYIFIVQVHVRPTIISYIVNKKAYTFELS